MIIIQSITYFFIIVIIIYASGWGIARWLLPANKKNQYDFSKCTVIGLIWVLLVCSWSSFLGWGFNHSFVIILIVCVLPSLLAFLIDIKSKNFVNYYNKPSGKEIIVIFISLVSGSIVLSPIILFNSLNPYIDGFTYISIADYLLEESYFQKADPNPYAPWLTQISLYQHYGFRMGTQFLLSFFTSIFGHSFSIYLLMPTLALGQLGLVLTMWLFCRISLKLSETASIIAVIFTAFHISIPITYSLNVFLPQSFGIVILLFTLALFLAASENRVTSNLVLKSLAFSALIVTYSELVPFAALSILLITLKTVITREVLLKKALIDLTVFAFITIILSNVFLINAYRAVLSQLHAVVGWHIPYTLWEYIIYLSSIPISTYGQIHNGFPLISGSIFICIMFIMYIIVKALVTGEYKVQMTNLIIASLPFIGVLCYFVFVNNNPWFPEQRGHSWSSYKTVQYLFVFVPPIIGIGMYEYMRRGVKQNYVVCFILCLFILCSFINGFITSKANSESMRSFTGSQEPLREYMRLHNEFINNRQTINLIFPDNMIKHRQLVAYFLRDHEIISDWTNDGYVYPHLFPDYRAPELNMQGITLVYNPHANEKIANLEFIGKRLFIDFHKGVHDLEHNEFANWRWASGTVELAVVNPHEVAAEVKIQFDTILTPEDLEVRFLEVWTTQREAVLSLYPDVANNHEIVIIIEPGVHRIVLNYDGQSYKVGNDPRDLAFNIINFSYDSTLKE